MKDRIIEAYLKDFLEEFGLSGLDESKAFEHFANYCVVSKHYADAFDPEEVAIGGGDDLGIDGLGILANDHLVLSPSDVDFFKKAHRRLDVQFIFVQAKTSPHFDAGDIGTFVAGVRQFFATSLPAKVNETARELYGIKEHISDSTIDMDQSPVCRLYYVTTGTWTDDPSLTDRIEQGRKAFGQPGSSHPSRPGYEVLS